ncbi:hypothetical protein TELCIR_11064 [Teladorsagia circumcincta]|uniref:Protein kinase domain-containing protein n=1 Tax=Teladorsagia circumcincta TaxID=45464 RepID=A0A2G9UAB1_TELCI|nr:hypothetical protein TELCIR_11064 [Teladorsagia circumcincta]
MSTGETLSTSMHETMESDPDYKSLLVKLEKDHRIKISEFLECVITPKKLMCPSSASWYETYLQKCDIVHRDLKCENVFLDRHENVKLGDFGFARYLRPHEKANTFCGSRAYVAPEILRAIAYTGQTVDIWSAGVVLYVMVTGVMPYDDRNPQKMVERQLGHKIRFPKIELSLQVKTLIYEILHPYPPSRPTYKAICSSDWLKQTAYTLKGVLVPISLVKTAVGPNKGRLKSTGTRNNASIIGKRKFV